MTMDTHFDAAEIGKKKIVALLFGIFMLLLAFAISVYNDVRQAQQQFVGASEQIERTLTRRIDSLSATLRSLSGVHHAMTRLSQQELSAFTQEIELSHPYVRAIVQLRHVEPVAKQRFEADMRDAGFPDFTIHDTAQSAHPGTRDKRHLVLSAAEPLAPALARHIGLDINSVAPLRIAAKRAITSGDIAGTDTTHIASDTFALVKAVYKGFYVPDTAKERHQQADGVYALLIDAPALLADIVNEHPRMGLALHASTYGHDTPLYAHAMHATAAALPRLLPVQQHFADVDLGAERLRISTRSMLVADSFQPSQWLTVIATLFALYLVGAMTYFNWLRIKATANEAQESLFEERERAHVTLQSIGEAVITTDPTAVVDFMNPIAEHLTGWKAEDACGRHLNEIFSLISENDGTALPDPVARALRDHDESEAAAIMVRSDGATVAVTENAAAIRDADGHFTGAALIIRDVSRERNLLREMAYQATHDPLTRLINRRQFEREIAAVIDDASTSGSQHGLMYIDLDQFKAINDSCGHIGGDQLLKQVASHLGDGIRRLDSLARLGGDEFGVLLRDCPVARALEVAESLRHTIKGQRLHWEGRSFSVSISIGVVAITKNSGNLDEVLRAADAACYVAKDQGRNRVHFYEPDDQMLAHRSTDMQWIHKLRDTIENNALVLYGQTIFPLAGGQRRPQMCELLVRMVDDDGRVVPPMTFIPAAERFNLMFDLDIWVIGAAFRHLAKLWQSNPDDQRIFTINLSGQSLDHPDLGHAIKEQELKYAINPHRICFEITETSVIANMDRALDLMDQLRRRGFLFALDDFGTGLSSFAYLKKLPVDFLKIDGEFVRDILADPVDKAMVDTIQRIGGVLGMTTIAEAIEDADTCKLLTSMGIDYGQGYHLGKPDPVQISRLGSNVISLNRRK